MIDEKVREIQRAFKVECDESDCDAALGRYAIGPAWKMHAMLDECLRNINRLRLERDMLALNPPGKDVTVFSVIGADGNISGVVWADPQRATDRELVFPKWFREATEKGGGE